MVINYSWRLIYESWFSDMIVNKYTKNSRRLVIKKEDEIIFDEIFGNDEAAIKFLAEYKKKHQGTWRMINRNEVYYHPFKC